MSDMELVCIGREGLLLMNMHQAMPPRRMNLGSGKDFRADYFNVDVDPTWFPDAVIDLSSIRDLDEGIDIETVRFGPVHIRPEYFEQIIANDVLEHVPDLVSLMTTCLTLLKVDGFFDISVPYDLSFGAWQDPTHVRSFNERSWLYYTDWFWYLGWNKFRFVIDSMKLVPSEFGQDLLRQGRSIDEITRTPRAIDSMSVRLRKILLTEEDRQNWHHFRESKKQQAQQQLLRNTISEVAHSTVAATRELRPFAGGWDVHQHRHCIWIVSPKGYQHQHAFDELAEALSEAFSDLGGSAPIVRSPTEWGGRAPIVLGANLLPAIGNPSLPNDSILVNLEQVSKESTWMTGEYYSLLQHFPVLDYSIRNQKALIEVGISHAQLLEIGYSQNLTRISRNDEKDIDVLFYGSLNERRAKVLHALTAKGLKVVHLFGVYGAERDATIARAKVVLNAHYYESAIFEIVRVAYLLSNRIAVVSEGDEADPDVKRLVGGLELVPYELLVERCIELVNDAARREQLAQRGFEAICASRQSQLLSRSLFPELLLTGAAV